MSLVIEVRWDKILGAHQDVGQSINLHILVLVSRKDE